MSATFASTPDFSAPRSKRGAPNRDQRNDRTRCAPWVTGLVERRELSSGLILQRMRVRDLDDRETHGTVQPGLKIGLVVGGQSDFSLGHQDFRLGPQTATPSGGMLVAIAEPDAYLRRAHQGQDEHKLVLTLMPECWVMQGEGDTQMQARLRAFQSSHLARLDWHPSPRALGLAQQIVHAPEHAGLIERLQQEARVMEILAEALATVGGQAPAKVALSPRDHRRLRELQARVDAGEFDASNLGDIALTVGMSPSSLQRAFKAFVGESLFEYMRGRRLEAARLSLVHEGLNVSQAATRAGYGNAGNFATAFKKRFGYSPKTARSR
ncbi:AraC family transcriptional regulator [Paucibacter aquatile]|uniref:AraC family transcriptional regulator n=2 Tax=Kinneretia aquatilis TaxID=2070761 RepID=A0A2N8KTW0_9BURK|nr:AraC family transcriptional regulator [Paucibacter aquatile]